jgi:hypothetical protein
MRGIPLCRNLKGEQTQQNNVTKFYPFHGNWLKAEGE